MKDFLQKYLYFTVIIIGTVSFPLVKYLSLTKQIMNIASILVLVSLICLEIWLNKKIDFSEHTQSDYIKKFKRAGHCEIMIKIFFCGISFALLQLMVNNYSYSVACFTCSILELIAFLYYIKNIYRNVK